LENVFDVLKQRGFVEQTTGDEAVHDLLEQPRTSYIGFDPTASSLHVGSLVPIMALAHMQRHGHRPIALVGGGTALVGDPSGKTEMRQMLTLQQVNENAEALKRQLASFVNFEKGEALLLNNAEWLTKLQYIPFLRDIGRHFSVNRMLASESCRLRLETGLSFIEFNYCLLQAYDFLHLYGSEDCVLQMGGSDQWGNIVAGVDLIRRVKQGTAHGITFPLITTSSGDKMGKTAEGAVWLDSDRTTPREYYQYWINTDDRDVARFMALFTFLHMDKVKEVEKLEGADLNSAKAELAFEATKLAHGEEQAIDARNDALSKFVNLSASIRQDTEVTGNLTVTRPTRPEPDSFMDEARLKEGIAAFKLFHEVGLADSRSAARRLIKDGGGYVNGRRIEAFDVMITDKHLNKGEILLRAGKKRYHRIRAKENFSGDS
jgi:tyrosyl-tRNA synthetase